MQNWDVIPAFWTLSELALLQMMILMSSFDRRCLKMVRRAFDNSITWLRTLRFLLDHVRFKESLTTCFLCSDCGSARNNCRFLRAYSCMRLSISSKLVLGLSNVGQLLLFRHLDLSRIPRARYLRLCCRLVGSERLNIVRVG